MTFNSLEALKRDGVQVIQKIQAQAKLILDPIIPEGSSVALIDYPNNTNVGDTLIWLGEISYLKSRNVKIIYTCDCKNYNKVNLSRVLDKSIPILHHGGGNFGTLWQEEHEFRLKVIEDFPENKIIQLPQSIKFVDEISLIKTSEIIKAHNDYTLLVRDQASLGLALNSFDCKSLLCPDMAFFIGPIDSNIQPLFDIFVLSRSDHEKSAEYLSRDKIGDFTIDSRDWLKASKPENFLTRLENNTKWLRSNIDPYNSILLSIWNLQSKLRMKRGMRLLERGIVVIADRLHVHILSILLRKPHVIIDNNYGKISGLHESFTKDYTGVTFSKTFEDAFVVADKYLNVLKSI